MLSGLRKAGGELDPVSTSASACPRGHPTPSTTSPSRAAFPAIHAVRARSRQAPTSPSPLQSPGAQLHHPCQAAPIEGESLSQEPGKGTPSQVPPALGTKWDILVHARVGVEAGGGQDPAGGEFGLRRDLGGSRGCLYCCRLAPPSVFLAVSATVSRFQPQKPPLGAGMQKAPPSFTQPLRLPLPTFLWDPAPLVPKPATTVSQYVEKGKLFPGETFIHSWF